MDVSIVKQVISSLMVPPWEIHEECIVKGPGKRASLPHGNIDMVIGRAANVCCSKMISCVVNLLALNQTGIKRSCGIISNNQEIAKGEPNSNSFYKGPSRDEEI